jgi:hypothetical protein
MDTDQWLVGWKEIGKYLGKSAKTAQRWERDGMPFFRDPSGRPMAQKSHLDAFILELNQGKHDDKIWRDEGIDTALAYENEKVKERKELDERFILAQRPVRSRF